MTEVKDVTGTAFVVAEFRARENAEPHPLYNDLVVPIFLDDENEEAADAIEADFPAGAKMPRLRTRYFDDRLDEQLAAAAARSLSWARASTRGACASARRASPISRSTIRARSASSEPAWRNATSMPRSSSSPATTSLRGWCRCLKRMASTATCGPFSSGKATPCI